jgi:oxygen-independent coproporphyrinogen-3 oxidase
MGYTEQETPLLIGLGASAISDAGTMYVQNIKEVEGWNEAVDAGRMPFFRGHAMTRSDMILRRHIHNIMCKGGTSWLQEEEQCPEMEETFRKLIPLREDGLVELQPFSVKVTRRGRPFLRNVGACFDARLAASSSGEKPVFSRTA